MPAAFHCGGEAPTTNRLSFTHMALSESRVKRFCAGPADRSALSGDDQALAGVSADERFCRLARTDQPPECASQWCPCQCPIAVFTSVAVLYFDGVDGVKTVHD